MNERFGKRYETQSAMFEAATREQAIAACALHLLDLTKAYPRDRSASSARRWLQDIASRREQA